MNEHELAVRLGLPDETIRALETIQISPAETEKRKRQFLQAPDDFENWGQQQSSGLTVLKIYLHLLPELRNAYAKRSIPEEILWDSCKDFGIWCRDYIKLHGKAGLDHWGWISMTMQMKLFRLGRLQFEPSFLPHDIRIGHRLYPVGTPHLEVHIPAEDPLDPEEVEKSLAEAIPFFRTYFSEDYTLFHCHSWLLAPALREILPESSRILQFQSLFTVYDRDGERQAEERVFGALCQDPAQYPQTTSLQRSLRRYLMQGNAIGVGLGLRSTEEESI